MQESSLHAALKDWYSKPNGEKEVLVDGYLIDVVHNRTLIEIQTGNFSAIKPKLEFLLSGHPVRLVHPIAREKWIIRLPAKGDNPQWRRKSPRRGRFEHLFLELIRIPSLPLKSNFSLEILLTKEEELRRNDGRGSWRRKGVSIIDHRLLEIEQRSLFIKPEDYLRLIPYNLAHPFTNRQLAEALKIPIQLARKMTYCLKAMNVIVVRGKKGNACLYESTFV